MARESLPVCNTCSAATAGMFVSLLVPSDSGLDSVEQVCRIAPQARVKQSLPDVGAKKIAAAAYSGATCSTSK